MRTQQALLLTTLTAKRTLYVQRIVAQESRNYSRPDALACGMQLDFSGAETEYVQLNPFDHPSGAAGYRCQGTWLE
jgi:hypothetical protein